MDVKINQFLESLSLSEKSIFAYRNALEQFVKIVGQDAVLSSETYMDFLISLQDKSPSTQRVYTTAVLKFYRYHKAGNWTELQDATRRYRRRSGKRIVKFNLEAVEKVISYCESLSGDSLDSLGKRLEALRDRAFVLTLADTGLRISEACSLKRGDIDWHEQRATLDPNNHESLIRFSNRSIRALQEYLSSRSKDFRKGESQIAGRIVLLRKDIFRRSDHLFNAVVKLVHAR